MSGREAGGCLDHSMLIGCSVSAEEAFLFAGVAAGSDGVDRIEKVRWSASVKAAEWGAERSFTAGVTRPPPCNPHGSRSIRGQKVGAIPGSKADGFPLQSPYFVDAHEVRESSDEAYICSSAEAAISRLYSRTSLASRSLRTTWRAGPSKSTRSA